MPESLDVQAKQVFDDVIDHPAAERARRLDAACAAAPDLRRRVEVLLAAAEKADAFLCGPTVHGQPALPQAADANGLIAGECAGARLGPYTLIERIGEGGFGSVYLAEQSAPIRRRVALKIIKAGMDTRQVIARFEMERQALALMDHPNIARVLDAGATESGRPYFVMELVRGEPITRYCDRQRLPLRRRLDLFREVCGAVQHAHQKGVIHRDLKPSNILVGGENGAAGVKVIDFGIAKATAGSFGDAALTGAAQLVGTPEYMSPEQAEPGGLDIDTRSDVYSLGVLLYELLTGMTPFDARRLSGSGIDGLRRIIRDEEPPRPSARLEALTAGSGMAPPPGGVGAAGRGEASSSMIEIAGRRRSEPATLVRTLRRDLDWIVLKCLEKDRSRRYEAASALADDVGRYLDDQPVRASPPGSAYKLRKFVRRNRAAVAAGAAISATVLAAAGVSIVFGMGEARQRRAAEKARDQVVRVADFQDRQLSGIDARTMGARLRASLLDKVREAAARSKLDDAATQARVDDVEQRIAGCDFTGIALASLDENFFVPAHAAIEQQFADEPLVRARLLQTLATTMRELGVYAPAEGPQREALDIRLRELGDTDAQTLTSKNEAALLLQCLGRLEEAEAGMRAALLGRKYILGDEHPDTLNSLRNLGLILQARGKLDEAAQVCGQALEQQRRVLGSEHRDTLTSMNYVGLLLQAQGKPLEAEKYFREALDTRRRVLGDEHRDTLVSIANMAALLREEARYDEAEPLYREALDKRRRVLGNEHPDTILSINNVGVFLKTLGRFEEAEQHYREAVELSRRVLGEDHPNTILAISNLGMLLMARSELAQAEPLLRDAAEKRSRIYGADQQVTLTSINNLVKVLTAEGKLDEAEPLAREVVKRRKRLLGEDHPDTVQAVQTLGIVLEQAGRLAEAEPFLREGVEKYRQRYGPDRAETLYAINDLARLLKKQGDIAGTIELLAGAEAAAREKFQGGNAAVLGRMLSLLGQARLAAKDYATADRNLREAYALLKAINNPGEPEWPHLLQALVELNEAWDAAAPGLGHADDAAAWREELQEWSASAH